MASKRRINKTTKALISSRSAGLQQMTVDLLKTIPEESVWLESRKSPQTRRAYRVDVAHFMRTFNISSPEELRVLSLDSVYEKATT